MKRVSDLTYKVSSYSEVPNFSTDDCVDWAVEMVVNGYESYSLLILSSLSKPTNYFEAIDYLKKSFNELSLDFRTGELGKFSYCFYLIKMMASGNNVQLNLRALHKIMGVDELNDDLINDFRYLEWAWGDLNYGNIYQDYWPEANKQNIQDIVVSKAKEWIEINKNKVSF
jgi:hypothetical protein